MTLDEFREITGHLSGDTEIDARSSLEEGDDHRFPVSDVEVIYGDDGSVTTVMLYNEEVVTATGGSDGDIGNI